MARGSERLGLQICLFACVGIAADAAAFIAGWTASSPATTHHAPSPLFSTTNKHADDSCFLFTCRFLDNLTGTMVQKQRSTSTRLHQGHRNYSGGSAKGGLNNLHLTQVSSKQQLRAGNSTVDVRHCDCFYLPSLWMLTFSISCTRGGFHPSWQDNHTSPPALEPIPKIAALLWHRSGTMPQPRRRQRRTKEPGFPSRALTTRKKTTMAIGSQAKAAQPLRRMMRAQMTTKVPKAQHLSNVKNYRDHPTLKSIRTRTETRTG